MLEKIPFTTGKRMHLTVKNLHKSFATPEGELKVLQGISLLLPQGSSLALTGESGCGKSTLLHLISGLDLPDQGEIIIGNRNIAQLPDHARAELRRNTVGIVFQQFNLIPSLNVAANMSFQARLADRHDPAWTAQLAERLGLTAFLNRYPEQLSGGQQQRVAIGRTLAAKPAFVLADEPTGNLDEATGDTVLDLLLNMVRDLGSSLLVVTHSERVATRLDKRIHMRAGKAVTT
jgi:putative ABC transport system ATP-binding protein